MATIRAAAFPNDEKTIESLWREYADGLRKDGYENLGDETVEADLGRLAQIYLPGESFVFLAEEETPQGPHPVGIVALQKLAGGDVEIRRLYVRKEAREKGLGKQLLENAVKEAGDHGYTTVKLDAFRNARTHEMYRSLGFTECEAYNAYPTEHMLWFEKKL